jgi:TolA-binding protein
MLRNKRPLLCRMLGSPKRELRESAMLADRRPCRLLGSPKRQLREYAPHLVEAHRIPSARGSGFSGMWTGVASNALRIALLALVATVLLPEMAEAQRPRRTRGDATQGEGAEGKEGEGGAYAAFQLLRKGQELLEAGEHDRGAKILETIVEQYPADPIRFRAYLALGKHALSRSQQMEAIGYLRNLKALEKPGAELEGEDRDLFLESLYLQGMAYFQTRQYAQAFPLLRRITNDFPNTVWANQSYYYIGMCHFAQGNWNKAIEALGLVGTFVDDAGDDLEYAEAGRRFYVKIHDTDLPVLEKLGAEVQVTIASQSGDTETIALVPLPGDEHASLGSVATDLGKAVPGDGTLQVIGGDSIRTSYVDGNTLDGQKDVARSREVKVVGTAAVTFTRGDFESPADAAFPGQPVFVALVDADLDVSDAADTATVRVVSRFKEEIDADESPATGVDLEKLLRSEEDQWRTRDEITVPLTEFVPATEGEAAPAGPVHSGRFRGQFSLGRFVEDQPVDQADQTLTVALGDEIVATFADERHIGGATPRTATATLLAASEIDSRPRAVQYEVADPVVAAKKSLVEAEAFLELGRIFRSMGLAKGAKEKVAEGLARVEPIIRQSGAIPASLTEQAFRSKWDLHITAGDYEAAIRTCELFNRLYPESPFVDQALLQIGRIKEEQKETKDAVAVYKRILGLKTSQIKAEAQYRIARAIESQESEGGQPLAGAAERAIVEYKICAERYPDSPFAGESLGKLIDYHIEKKDNAAASELLEQIFQDYPDAQFLDAMLLKWVMVAYRMGDVQKAHDKCSQLLFEYPASPYAERGRAIMPKIEAKLKPAGGEDTAQAGAGN